MLQNPHFLASGDPERAVKAKKGSKFSVIIPRFRRIFEAKYEVEMTKRRAREWQSSGRQTT